VTGLEFTNAGMKAVYWKNGIKTDLKLQMEVQIACGYNRIN
jgi:hypothetical protein